MKNLIPILPVVLFFAVMIIGIYFNLRDDREHKEKLKYYHWMIDYNMFTFFIKTSQVTIKDQIELKYQLKYLDRHSKNEDERMVKIWRLFHNKFMEVSIEIVNNKVKV